MNAPMVLLVSLLANLMLNGVTSVYMLMRNPGWMGRNAGDIAVACKIWGFITLAQAVAAWPIAWLFLRRKESRRAARYWFTITCVMAAPCFVFWHWLMALLFVAPLAVVLAAVISGSLLPNVYLTAGLCFKCGYDLTDNVSGVCPECGRPILQDTPGVDRR